MKEVKFEEPVGKLTEEQIKILVSNPPKISEKDKGIWRRIGIWPSMKCEKINGEWRFIKK